MRRDLAFLVMALSSAVLLFAAVHAQAQTVGTYVLRSPAVFVDPELTGEAQVLCNGSDVATGGGLASSVGSTAEKMHVSDSFPISDASGAPALDNAAPHGWKIIVFNPTLESLELQAFVVCLTNRWALTVSTAGTGTGTVSSSDGSISCPGTCTAAYNGGTSVTLTATPGTGSIFAGWTGCDTVLDTTCTVTMSASRLVTATFDVQRFTLTVSTAGTGTGTVSSSDGLINSCSGTCTATYNSGTSVTLTATPDAGSIFTGWTGCDTVLDTTCTVSMSASRSVTATFDVP